VLVFRSRSRMMGAQGQTKMRATSEVWYKLSPRQDGDHTMKSTRLEGQPNILRGRISIMRLMHGIESGSMSIIELILACGWAPVTRTPPPHQDFKRQSRHQTSHTHEA
jgi:hypothetical protein